MNVPLQHGPEWATALGARVGAYLNACIGHVDVAARATAGMPDAVIVTGELDAVAALLGPHGGEGIATTRAAGLPYATVAMRPRALFERLAAVEGAEYATKVSARHDARGDLRTMLVCLGADVVCVQMLTEVIDAEAFAARGGQA